LNEQIIEAFLVESEELLSELEHYLLASEDNQDPEERVNALFRAAHTLKGSAGIVGVEVMEKFTHWMEHVLERVRTQEIPLDQKLTNLLLDGHDHLLELHQSVSEHQDPMLNQKIQNRELELIHSLQEYLPEEEGKQVESTVKTNEISNLWKIQIEFGESTFKDGFDPSSFITYLSKLGNLLSTTTDWSRIPNFENFDPEDCYLNVEILLQSEHEKAEIEDAFEFIREDSHITIMPPEEKERQYIETIHGLEESAIDRDIDRTKLGKVLVNSGAITQHELDDVLKNQQAKGDEQQAEKIGELLVQEGSLTQPVLKEALKKQEAILSKADKVRKTIRIDTEKLDELVNLVGELVITGASATERAQVLKDEEMIEITSMINRLVEDIRERSMQTRMVPIEATFNRFHKVIREINRDMGKQIQLKIQGEDAELDKNVIEKIVDPLLHLIRNAADHGIETPQERIRQGKNETGIIQLNAFHDSGSVVIEIKDDGKGISTEQVLAKAMEKGLVSSQQKLTREEILNLIFLPGFSTAEKVTKFSGRGVGMDVVKSNIEGLRGDIQLSSSPGEGSTFRIILPLTMAIIDGLLVGVGNSRYVIPLDFVMECISLPPEAHNATHQFVNLRGAALPYLWLRKLFQETNVQAAHQYIVVVKYSTQQAGLVVDQLFGEIQVVIKSLGRIYQDVPGISGATILGNGEVSLIVDIPRLILYAEKEQNKKAVSVKK